MTEHTKKSPSPLGHISTSVFYRNAQNVKTISKTNIDGGNVDNRTLLDNLMFSLVILPVCD